MLQRLRLRRGEPVNRNAELIDGLTDVIARALSGGHVLWSVACASGLGTSQSSGGLVRGDMRELLGGQSPIADGWVSLVKKRDAR